MNVRNRFGLSMLVVAAFAFANAAWADDKKDHDKHSAHFEQCAKACADCMRECDLCARHCADLVAAGQKEHLRTLGACLDCSSFCTSAAKITARRGPMAGLICEACAKACDECGAACEKFPDDAMMAKCAKECRNCAKACREMLKHIGHEAHQKQ